MEIKELTELYKKIKLELNSIRRSLWLREKGRRIKKINTRTIKRWFLDR